MTDNYDQDIAFLAKQIASLRKQVRSLGRSSQMAFRSHEMSDGPLTFYDQDGDPVGDIGDTERPILNDRTGTPPPQPTPPEIVPIEGGVMVSYDGTFEEDNWTTEISHVEAHILDSEGDPTSDGTQFYTFTSDNGGAAVYPLDAAEGEKFFVLQAVGTNLVEGPVSDATPGTGLPTATARFPITETDIADNAISTPKLQANSIDGMIITGAVHRTAATGNRMVMRDDGIGGVIEWWATGLEFAPGVMNPGADSSLQIRGAQVDSGDPKGGMDISPEDIRLYAYNITVTGPEGDETAQTMFSVEGIFRAAFNAHSQRDLLTDVNIPNDSWTVVDFDATALDHPPNNPPPDRPVLIDHQGIGYFGGTWQIEQRLKYIITATAVFESNATGRRGVRIMQNGSELTSMETGAVGGDQGINVSITRDLAIEDNIEVEVYQNSGGPLSLKSKSIVTITGIS